VYALAVLSEAPGPVVVAGLAVVAFGAGFVDAVGGGGGLLTVPALLAAGLAPHVALGTNKGQACFGAVSSAVSYWRGGEVDRPRALPSFLAGLSGAAAGAAAQLAVRPEPLKPIVLVLLSMAAALVVLRPAARARASPPASPRLVASAVGFAMGAYDGFFGPGTGSLLILAFITFLGDGMLRASGNAKIVNLASNLASVAIFAWRGTVLWSVAIPMAAGNAFGAFVGVRTAIRGGERFVRVVLVVVVVALLAKVAWDLVRR
jgi:uncharacterized membrane protein YfcA